MKKFLGIDYSLNKTGYCILDKNGELFDCGLIKNIKKLKENERLYFLYNGFKSLVITKSGFEAIGLEGYSFGSRAGMAFSIGEGCGILKLLITMLNRKRAFKFYTFPPTTIKKFVTGSGRGEKSLMIKYVYKIWNFDNDDEDIVDAFAIAKFTYCYHLLKHGKDDLLKKQKLKSYQYKVLEELLKKRNKENGKKN